MKLGFIRRRLPLFAAFWLITVPPLLGTQASAVESAWSSLAFGRYLEAEALFRDGLAHGSSDANLRLGLALAALGSEPTDGAGHDRAMARLRELGPGEADPEIRSEALAIAGKILQLQGRPEAAAALDAAPVYRETSGTWLNDEGVIARVQIGLAHLKPDEAKAAFARAEGLLGLIRSPRSLANAHLVLAETALRALQDKKTAQRHIEAALSCGIGDPALRADLLLSAGSLAAGAGENDLAKARWAAFLTENPYDGRVNAVRERLTEIGSPIGRP